MAMSSVVPHENSLGFCEHWLCGKGKACSRGSQPQKQLAEVHSLQAGHVSGCFLQGRPNRSQRAKEGSITQQEACASRAGGRQVRDIDMI